MVPAVAREEALNNLQRNLYGSSNLNNKEVINYTYNPFKSRTLKPKEENSMMVEKRAESLNAVSK